MNTLIFYMSLNGKTPTSSKIHYSTALCQDGFVEGSQTNEAATQCVIKLLHDKGESLDRIIGIVSNEVYENGTYDDFVASLNEFYGKGYSLPEMLPVMAENKPNAAILEQLDSLITKNDHIYLDTTGGRRDAANLIQLLVRLMNYKHINTELSLYSELEDARKVRKGEARKGEVRKCEEVNLYLDVLDGVNQFATSGRVEQLRALMSDSGNENVTKLFCALETFSDSLLLCNMDGLDDELLNIRKALDRVEKMQCSGGKELLIKVSAPIIREKLFADRHNSDEYCNLVKWCVENSMIQQALTIFIEKIPDYLFKCGLLTVKDNSIVAQVEREHNKPGELNKYASIFYEKLIGSDMATRKCDMVCKVMNNGLPATTQENDVNVAVRSLRQFERVAGKEEFYKEKLGDILAARRQSPEVLFIAEKANNEGDYNAQITIKKFLSNKPLLLQLMPVESKLFEKVPSGSVYRKKLYTAANIQKDGLPYWIGSAIPLERLEKIMFDYIYTKILRNQINHASTNECLTPDEKAILKNKGYDIDNRTVEVIGNQLLEAIKHIK